MKVPTQLIFHLLCAFALVQLTTASLVVDTPVGSIKGKKVTAANNKPYVSFRNIPFAKAPVGELRFAKPVPHPKFGDSAKTTFDATQNTVHCVQPQFFLFNYEQGNEDCLVLNIFLKELPKPGQKKKVLVFIPGGGFLVSSSQMYKPGNFVIDNDVIVVTINYRIGVLGFLSSQNEASPGNYGLWDQVLALKWVKDNIAAFGGDADDITIGGESSGASSVSFLSLSPVTQGLFTRAYVHSCAATTLAALATTPQLDFLTIAKTANCWDGEVNEEINVAQGKKIVECLRTRPAGEISNIRPFSVEKTSVIPVVDGHFLPKHPSKLLLDGGYLDSIGFFNRPYLAAVNNNEHAIAHQFFSVDKYLISSNKATDEEKEAMLNNLISTSVRNALRVRLDTKDIPDVLADKIYKWYERRFGDSAIPNLIGDLYTIIPVFEFLNTLSRSKTTPAWLFHFNHYPNFIKGPQKGMMHGLGLGFMFDFPVEEIEAHLHAGITGEYDEEDMKMKRLFQAVVGEFVKTGKPYKAMKEELATPWPQYDPQGDQYLDLSPRPSIQRRLERERRELWTELVPQWVSELKVGKKTSHTEL